VSATTRVEKGGEKAGGVSRIGKGASGLKKKRKNRKEIEEKKARAPGGGTSRITGRQKKHGRTPVKRSDDGLKGGEEGMLPRPRKRRR